MDDIYSQILCWLATINPAYPVIAAVVWLVFGGKLKALVVGLVARVKVFLTREPSAEAWLEQHPLLDRVWEQVKTTFSDQIADDKTSEDDAYIAILNALKGVKKPDPPAVPK